MSINNASSLFGNTISGFLNNEDRVGFLAFVFGLTWLVGGMVSDFYIYFLSMTCSVCIAVYLLLKIIATRHVIPSQINSLAYGRAIVAFLAYWMNTTGGTQMSNNQQLFEYPIPILDISTMVIAGFFLLWFATRYFNPVDVKGMSKAELAVMTVRGLLRGAMIFGMFFALFTKTIVSGVPETVLLLAYVVEPLVYVLYAKLNASFSAFDLSVGSSRLPSVAFRESVLSNLLILLVTFMGGLVQGDAWNLLRAVYIIGLIFAIAASRDDIQKFNANPLGSSMIGNFINNIPQELQKIDLSEQYGHIMTEQVELKLATGKSLALDPGSILIPISEKKGKVNVLVAGEGTNIIMENGRKIAKDKLEGLGTLVIDKKQLRPITKKYIAQQLATLDFSELRLPSLEVLQDLTLQLGINLQELSQTILGKLKTMDLSNYSITETAEYTKVVLPGIFVHEDRVSHVTNVNVANLVRVVDANQGTAVRIGNFLQVLDLPKVTLVNLPFLKVIELAHEGTFVELFGMKISDGVSAQRANEFIMSMSNQIDQFNASAGSKLGKSLADGSAVPYMTLSWKGEFKSLIATNKETLDNIPILTGRQETAKMLPAGTKTADASKLEELTGLSFSSDGYLKVNRQRHSEEKQRRREEKQLRKTERHQRRDQRKAAKLEAKLGRSRIDIQLGRSREDITNDLNAVEDEIADIKENKKKDHRHEDLNIVEDADYEILDD